MKSKQTDKRKSSGKKCKSVSPSYAKCYHKNRHSGFHQGYIPSAFPRQVMVNWR